MRRLLIPASLGALLVMILLTRTDSAVQPQGVSPEAEARGDSATPGTPRALPEAGAESARVEAPSELRGEARRLPGRCEDWLTGEGLVGARLAFLDRGERVEVTSAHDGTFTTPPVESAEQRALEVEPPDGYWVVEHGPKVRANSALYVARLAPHTHGPLRLQLLDRLTGEPLPEYILELRDGDGWSETVRSDAEGRLTTEVLFPAGTIELWSTEEERGVGLAEDELGRVDFSPAGAAPPLLSVSIESGPTYKLELSLPEGLEPARLSAYIESADWVDQVEPEFDPGQSLRLGTTTWVRFPEDMSWKQDPRLLLLGPGGRWRGLATIDASPGRHLTPVHVRVDRQAQLLGTVVDARGATVPRAEVELTANGEGGELLSRWARTNGRGNFSLEGLTPGTYSLSLRHFTAGALTKQIEVRGSSDERERFQLEPFLAAGELTGVVRSTSGEFSGNAQVVLRPRASADGEFLPRRAQRLSWTLEGSEQVARFHFSQVAHAEYEVSVLAPWSPYRVEPDELLVTPPDQSLELTIRDEVEVYSLTFLPLDADTGRWLSETHLQVRDAAGEEIYAGPTSGWNSPSPLSEAQGLDWRLSKEGYLTVRGDRSAFTGTAGTKYQQAVVRLRRH